MSHINIYQINQEEIIKNFITDNINCFTCLLIVTSKMDIISKIQLRRYLKKKAKQYPERRFVYVCSSNFEKLEQIINEYDTSKICELKKVNFPMMIHMYNDSICYFISRFTFEISEESFREMDNLISQIEKAKENTKEEEEEEMEEFTIKEKMDILKNFFETVKDQTKLDLYERRKKELK